MEALSGDLPGSIIHQEEVEAVLAAVQNPEWNFRSPQGIEGETGVPASTAEAILEMSSHMVRRSVLTDREDRTLYAPKDRAMTWKEVLERSRLMYLGRR